MKLLAVLSLAALLSSCALPFTRTYSLQYRDAAGREIGTSVRVEAAEPKRLQPLTLDERRERPLVAPGAEILIVTRDPAQP